MIPVLHRFDLRKHPDFYKTFQRVYSQNFTFFYEHAPAFQISVVISKKVAHSAVVRNKNKRRLKAVLLRFESDLAQKVCVVVIKKDITKIAFSTLVQQMQDVIQVV